MTFRRDSLIFYESQIAYIGFAILCLTMIPMYGFKLSLLFCALFILVAFINPRFHNEFVTINETGILCCKAGKVIWQYKWESIAKLQKSSRFRMLSIEIAIYDDYHENNTSYILTGHYFQLGKTAKNAIEKYAKNVTQRDGFSVFDD